VNAMELVALVERSDGVYPGHMVIGQESTEGEAKFFGYRFDPTELPAEFCSSDRWQEYLFSNKTYGSIYDEIPYLRLARAQNRVFYEKRASCEEMIEAHLPPPTQWFHFADYSFSPDDFHSDASPCYHCVTWATMIGNHLVSGFLTPVRQGRIKLNVKQIRLDGQVGGTDE
jgi:hypothetical protein